MSTATLVDKDMTLKSTISKKTAAWCRKVAEIAKKRIFRVKNLTDKQGMVDLDKIEFTMLPKIYHRKRISHTDRESTIMLHPEFFDEKGNIRKKLPKEKREELKAAIYKEVTHFVTGKRPNTAFYKAMVRCPWKGPRVDGAKGSTTEARTELKLRREKKLTNRRKMEEIPTGLKEDVKIWSLTEQKHVLVKNADIFIGNGKIKIARGVYNGKKVRGMLSGGAELKSKLNL